MRIDLEDSKFNKIICYILLLIAFTAYFSAFTSQNIIQEILCFIILYACLTLVLFLTIIRMNTRIETLEGILLKMEESKE